VPIHDWTRVNDGTWHDFCLGWISEIRNILNGGRLPPSYYAQVEQDALIRTAGGAAMPIHDWTRVNAGTWHAFHLSWISELQAALNGGRLPPSYYAQAEQIVGPLGPDVLTLQTVNSTDEPEAELQPEGGLAVAVAPPRTRVVDEVQISDYALRRRTLVIRHASSDRIVALLELMSPGNKAAQFAFRSFVDKAVEAIWRGYHLLIVDLFPPTPRDPEGIHGAIWAELGSTSFKLPPGEPLTLAAYSAGPTKRAYVEPTAVGRTLLEMPLFLEPEIYINVPLEESYLAAYRGVPERWKRVLEGRSAT